MKNTLENLTMQNEFEALDVSIFKGVDFLYFSQLKYGEFKTLVSPKANMKEYYQCPASSPYITTYVLYSINFLKHQKVIEMTRKALNFLQEELEEPGVWRFYTRVNRKVRYCNGQFVRDKLGIIPDLDDTACASYALKDNQITFCDNSQIFLDFKNKQEIFYTWVLKNPKHQCEEDPTVYIPPYNNTCCGVNANILLYLRESADTKGICSYLNDIVANGKEMQHSAYFPSKIVLYYLLSRAYFNGAKSLEISIDLIVNRIVSSQGSNSYYREPLSTALAVCTLLNFGRFIPLIHDAISSIVSSQNINGSWARASLFIDSANYYGSEELTTAICVEALTKYFDYVIHYL